MSIQERRSSETHLRIDAKVGIMPVFSRIVLTCVFLALVVASTHPNSSGVLGVLGGLGAVGFFWASIVAWHDRNRKLGWVESDGIRLSWGLVDGPSRQVQLNRVRRVWLGDYDASGTVNMELDDGTSIEMKELLAGHVDVFRFVERIVGGRNGSA